MLKIPKVAITGSLCCGKSSVCRFFEELGAEVVSTDAIVHQLLAADSDIDRMVVALLGKDVVADGALDRKAIADKVFADRDLLEKLENLLHPAVRKEVGKRYQQVASQGQAPLFVVEIPLLFETNGQSDYDVTVAVIADEELSRRWFKDSTGCDEEQYHRRASRQLASQEKADSADHILVNDGDLLQLKDRVRDLFHVIGHG